MSSQTGQHVLIIGGGPGGYHAAIHASKLGFRVTLVEKNDRLGGVCLNTGCIPSKALLTSSQHVRFLQHQAAAHGISAENFYLDLSTMMARKTQVVDRLGKGVSALMKQNNIEVVHGTAHLVGTNSVFVKHPDGTNTTIQADFIILAAGSEPAELPFLKFDGQRVLSSTHALSLPSAPESMIVIGAGAIGLELGSVWSRLGTTVTVVEFLPRIAPGIDEEIASSLKNSLTKQGLTFQLNTQVQSADVLPDKVRLKVSQNGSENVLEAQTVLLAVGRKPAVQELFLEEAGIQLTPQSRIQVNEHWQTHAPNIYAIGDLVEGPMLAHKAEAEGRAVAERLAGKPGMVNRAAIPGVIYTAPEAAGAGLTEQEAKEQNFSYRIGKHPFMANGRALAGDVREGFVKLVIDERTDRILGAHILGEHASELIAECIVLLEFGASAEDLARTIHAHPTLSEAVHSAAEA